MSSASGRFRLIAAHCTAAAILAAVPAVAAPGIKLDPHRAVYDLSLETRKAGAAVSAVTGRMVHEFSGAACDGYSITMRWVARMTDTEGEVSIDDVRFASWEEGNGSTYTYTSTRFLNDQMVEEVRAKAEREATGGRVELTKPEDTAFPLPPGTVFPTHHLISVLRAAMAGRPFEEKTVYDVSEDGRQIYTTMAVLGTRHTVTTIEDLATGLAAIPAAEKLKDMPVWRVTVSYFEGNAQGEETPAFEQTFDLLANGVAASLLLDYGEVVIRGTLKDLEFLSEPACEGAEAQP